MICLLFYGAIIVGEEPIPAESHSIKVPLTARSISINVINDNGHTIAQHNSSNMKVDSCAIPSSSHNQAGLLARTFNSIWSHKLGVLCSIAVLGYAGLLSALLYLEYTINQNHGWAYWRKELSLETLQSLDQQLLAKDLFEDIKDKYLPSTYTALNFLDPIVCFINDCDQEMKMLERFISLRNWVACTKLAYVMPAQEQVIAKTIEATVRLKYVKKLLILYLSEYQIDA